MEFPRPVLAVLYLVVRCVPIAEDAGDRSDREDTSWAVPATAPPRAEELRGAVEAISAPKIEAGSPQFSAQLDAKTEGASVN
jgi:hypothetical protein